MGKRQLLLKTLILLGLGTLLWGVLSLRRIFADERDAAEETLARARHELASHARAALVRRLHADLAATEGRLAAARDDVLAPSSGLLYIDEGQQTLPRVVRFRPGDDTPARELYERLRNDQAARDEPDGPWADRVALLATLERAIARKDRPGITGSVRALLNHRVRYVLPVETDLPLLIRFLEVLVAGTDPDPALLGGLLRDGLRGSGSHHLAGLQPLLIDTREHFSAADVRFLAARLIDLSDRAGVPSSELAAAAAAPPTEPLGVPPTLSTAILFSGMWYIEPLGGGTARGVSFDGQLLLSEIEAEMRTDHLLSADDRLDWQRPLLAVESAADLPLDVPSPRWTAQLTAIRGRYRLKTALGAAVGALAAAIVVLSAVLIRRERRHLRSRSQFVAAVSHELRTPLAGVRVMAETLERQCGELPDLLEFASRIVKQADRLTFLVDNILSFNRLEKRHLASDMRDVDLAEVVQGLREQARAFTSRPVRIQLAGDAEPHLPADRELIRLLLSNLVSNACRYNDRTPIEIEIAATAGPPPVLFVRDNGVGIPRGMWQRVFVEFFRAPQVEPTTVGFGLGLAICRRIMTVHGGHIEIIASDSDGTTFELRFGART